MDISELKKEKNALILAHYYQSADVRAIADHVCDSFEMARRAAEAQESILVICGVRFMAESAKLLNPEKTVLLPAPDAGCPMADMITPEDVEELRKKHPDAPVVCYVNSSAYVKAVSDICCTSSSAVRIVKSLPQKHVVFIPDKNLGAYVASKVPNKKIILFDGFCPIHHGVAETDIIAAKRVHPRAEVLIHPECKLEVLAYADYIGSTAGIIERAMNSQSNEFIIGTEREVAENLSWIVPTKRFFTANNRFLCHNMKKTQIRDVENALLHNEFEVVIDEETAEAARKSLKRMVKI